MEEGNVMYKVSGIVSFCAASVNLGPAPQFGIGYCSHAGQ